MPDIDPVEITLEDFDRELTINELQQAVKQLIVKYNTFVDDVVDHMQRTEASLDALEREHRRYK